MEVKTNIKLVANDKTVHEVSSQAAKRSKFICDLLADFKDTEISVAEANGPTLKEIIEYLEHYKDEEPREIQKPMEEDQRLPDMVEKWDVDFVERSQDLQRLQDLIVAADYMGIDPLHELMVAKMACIMLDLGSAEAIVKHFNIEEDMTEEEMRQMEKEELEELKKRRAEEFKARKEKEEADLKKTEENGENAEKKD
jgi:hypothetical protein